MSTRLGLLLVPESDTVTAIISACEAQWRVAVTLSSNAYCVFPLWRGAYLPAVNTTYTTAGVGG